MADEERKPKPDAPDQRHLIDAAFAQAVGIDSKDELTRHWRAPEDRPPPRVETLLPGYQVRRQIQRGGQGVVYECLQESTNRVVAVKLLHDNLLALPTEKARFEREVHTLARLRHPNIVTVHDSGVVDGTAFLVMDYIAGRHLDRFVDQAELSLTQRLSLVARVCEAVNVAHLNGIIHRDLKPSNIRVDDDGEPHILDFGLAKWADAGANSAGVPAMTETGQFVGSLPWASPEQAEGRLERIDIRTDVYSLGVMLYQLLTGTFPYKVTGSLRETADNILHAPPKHPRQYNPRIDDELVTIAFRSLDKNPQRRYQNAGELGRDLRHYLAGEPIEAKRDSFGYLLRKQIARHRGVVAFVSSLVVLLAVGFAVSLTLWRRAEASSTLAEHRRQVAERETAHARREAAKAQAVGQFLIDMLTAADPTGKHGPDTTVRQTLETARVRIDAGAFAGEPAVEAALRSAMGRTYLRLGLLADAETQLIHARELTRASIGTQNRDYAVDLNNLGMLARAQGDLDAAADYFHQALDILKSLDEPHLAELADAYANLALILYRQGAFDQAAQRFEQARDIEQSIRMASPEVATTLHNYAMLLREMGDLEHATKYAKEALDILLAAYGREHVHVAGAIETLGSMFLDRGAFDEAEARYREALAIRRRVLGDEHPDVATGLNNLGYLLFTQQRYDEAEPLYREALSLRRQILEPDHPQIASILNNLGLLLAKRGDAAAAEPLYREALEIKETRYGQAHPSTLLQRYNLGSLLRDQGRFDEAEPLLRNVTTRAAEALPEEHWYRALFRGGLGACLLEMQRYAEAEPELLACHEGLVKRFGPDHARPRLAAEKLAALYDATQRPAKARAWREQAAAPDADKP